MINQSRLSQVNSFSNTRTGQDDLPNLNPKLANVDSEGPLSASGSLLSGNSAAMGNTNLAGANSFTQLLELSKAEKPQASLVKNQKDEKTVADASDNKEVRKKAESNDGNKKAGKSKDKKNRDDSPSEQTLSQLLLAQQDGMNKNSAALDSANKNTESVKTSPVANNRLKQANENLQSMQEMSSLSDKMTAGDQSPKSLNDVMKTLDSKLGKLADMQKTGHIVAEQPQGKLDDLSNLASKFDDVKFEFNQNEMGQTASKIASGTAADGKVTPDGDLLKKLAALEWSQNDLALRDLVAQQTFQEQALEKLTLDRLDQLSQLKAGQLDNLQLQDARSAELLKQVQAREALSSAQPQWTSYRDMTPDQKAMVDAMTSGQSLQNQNQVGNNARSEFITESNPTGRLANPNSNGPSSSPLMQDAVAGLNSMSQLSGEQAGNSPGRQDSSSNSSQGGRANVIGEVTATKSESLNSTREKSDVNTENAQRARESERTREMARSAALRAQSIASELAVKGGGTAKVQIKDSQLGVVELRINMADNNRVSIDLVANSDRVKQELEKQSDELKSGLEKHNVVLEGVRFVTDTKLGDSGFQNSSQSDNTRSNQQQQQQQQQNFSSFSQGNQSSQQQNFGGGERFFERPAAPIPNNTASAGGVRKNYSGKNDAQTNVQRAANGSLKVTA
ncbi:MAG: hypothetical protein RI953_2380 [Pseudomonadota bacterium]